MFCPCWGHRACSPGQRAGERGGARAPLTLAEQVPWLPPPGPRHRKGVGTDRRLGACYLGVLSLLSVFFKAPEALVPTL